MFFMLFIKLKYYRIHFIFDLTMCEIKKESVLMLTRIIQKDQNLIIFENQELTRKNGIVYNITLTSFH